MLISILYTIANSIINYDILNILYILYILKVIFRYYIFVMTIMVFSKYLKR